MEVVVSKKDEEDMTKFNMKIGTGSRMEKAWVSFKEAATDRTFILPFVIVCTLFTFQALSG